MHPSSSHRPHGFTIVELLIVIVVIAILAAITLVTYSGIQQRANNAAIIDAASKSLRMIQAYIAANGTYPKTTASGDLNLCITYTSGCQGDSTSHGNITYTPDSTFTTNMATIGKLPASIPSQGDQLLGINYTYTVSTSVNGATQPATLVYWLFGTGQQCGVSGVLTYVNGVSWTLPTTVGYTNANDGGSGKTLCVVTIPGPSA